MNTILVRRWIMLTGQLSTKWLNAGAKLCAWRTTRISLWNCRPKQWMRWRGLPYNLAPWNLHLPRGSCQQAGKQRGRSQEACMNPTLATAFQPCSWKDVLIRVLWWLLGPRQPGIVCANTAPNAWGVGGYFDCMYTGCLWAIVLVCYSNCFVWVLTCGGNLMVWCCNPRFCKKIDVIKTSTLKRCICTSATLVSAPSWAHWNDWQLGFNTI